MLRGFFFIIAQMSPVFIPKVDCHSPRPCEVSLPMVLALHVSLSAYIYRIPQYFFSINIQQVGSLVPTKNDENIHSNLLERVSRIARLK